MGQPDLTLNKLISHPDIFADIINAIVYEGDTVLEEEYLKPFYMNNSATKNNGKLKGLYRDTCMEDIRDGIRYVIWGIENQYVPDRTTPFKVMGYDYTAYDRQIEEFTAQNKKDNIETYVNGLLPEQKLKPVITIVLYYRTDDIPDSICAVMDMPKKRAVRKYIQDYRLNLIRLADLTKEQVEKLHSEFACIAKFVSNAYNKEEQLKTLKNISKSMLHAKDTLLALAAITKDNRYLELSEQSKEDSKMCEVLDALIDESVETGRKKGRIEGKIEGRIEERANILIETLEEMGALADSLRELIMEQNDLDVLKKWHKIAIKADSVNDFEENIKAIE